MGPNCFKCVCVCVCVLVCLFCGGGGGGGLVAKPMGVITQ